MKAKSQKKPVGCRLEEEYRTALAAVAAERGKDVSDVIHGYILAGLRDEAARESLFDILSLIRIELREGRRDHALMAEVLLHAAGQIDKAGALDWAEKNIKAV